MQLLVTAFVLASVSGIQGMSIGSAEVISTRAEAIDLTHFNLWTRKNPTVLQELFINDSAVLAASNFDVTKPTKVFVHGWRMNGYDNQAVLTIRDEFLIKEDCNFIAVDWEKLAGRIDYYISAANTQPVGILTGDFFNFLTSQGVDINQIYPIGFSLGAHVVGKAGALTNGLIPRITGLDPAYPGFSLENTDERLDVTDALFVDIMHTNSGTLLSGGLSFLDSIGHVDFWPNGGEVQPGCFATGSDIFAIATGCSHGRAHDYFAESINGNPFTSIKCTSYQDFGNALCNGNQQTSMGLRVSTNVSGDFFLNTFDRAPFSMG